MTKDNYDDTQVDTKTENVSIQIVEGISKKTKNPYKCLEIQVGDYSARVFPTKIELLYIESILNNN